MVYHGRVKGGVIVPDPPAELPEGAKVNIEVVDDGAQDPRAAAKPAANGDPPFAGLLNLAGQAPALPPDAARNYKHYLYGTPKEDTTGRP
jgi:hypothetical protein